MDITVTNLQSNIPVSASKIQTAANKVIKTLKGFKPYPAGISLVFVGTKRMRSMNRKHLGHDYVTDVITFDLEDSAEIIICPAMAMQNAKVYKQPVQTELLLYVIHGLLHLAGFDDHTPRDIAQMRLKEAQLLKKIL
jgi:probable rRNA maturation factor